MRLVFAVLVLFVAYVASFPAATENEENDLEYELRSILNQFDNEQEMTRSIESDESDDEDDDDNDDEFEFAKRQGGHNIVDKQSKCEIECIHKQRFPGSGKKGKSVKHAAKACQNICPRNTPLPGKKNIAERKGKPLRPVATRQFDEEQQYQRRQLFDFLLEQLDEN